MDEGNLRAISEHQGVLSAMGEPPASGAARSSRAGILHLNAMGLIHMTMKPSLTAAAALMFVGLVVAVACGGQAAPEATAAATPTTATARTPTSEPPTPTATVIVPAEETISASGPAEEYDSNANMFLLFSDEEQSLAETVTALQLARDNNDRSMVPVIIEILRFFQAGQMWFEAGPVLRFLTGQDIDTNSRHWNEWMEWRGRNLSEYQPPDQYGDWKTNLYGLIDPRYILFLSGADATARIDLTELAWGGVRPDGIPDLEFPTSLAVEEQGYMLPDDRVFGVSINGEHRAYPLRIINAHEMANDFLGGEQIALAY